MRHDPDSTTRLLAETAWLRRLARCLTAGRDTADDIVQETLLRACAAPLASIHNLRAWLAVVAANTARRFARQANRQQHHHRHAPERAPEPSVAEAVLRTEAQRRVMTALLALAEPYRTVLLLRFQAELGYAAIAARLGIPIETVRTQIKRGLQQLRRDLDAGPGGRAAWAGPLATASWPAAAAMLVPLALTTALAGWLLATDRESMAPPADAAAPPLAAALPEELVEPRPRPSTTTTPTLPSRRDPVLLPTNPTRLQPDPNPATPAAEANATASAGVHGRVLDAHTRAPIAGATVELVERFLQFTPTYSAEDRPEPPAARITSTDADGCFLLTAAAGGTSQLRVQAPGHPRHEQFVPPDLAIGDVLLAPANWSRLRVVTDTGRPAIGAELFTFVDDGKLQWTEPLGCSDRLGTWGGVVPHAADSVTFLVAVHAGTTGWVRVAPGEEHTITLGPRRTLRVQVVDDLGAPLSGARVMARPHWQPGPADGLAIVGGTLWQRLRIDATTDATGAAHLPELACAPQSPGCGLLVTADGHRGEQRHQPLAGSDQTVRVVLPRGATTTLRGRVVDAQTLQPIVGALVGTGTITDANGSFEQPDFDLRHGAVRLDITAHGYVPHRIDEPVGGRSGGLWFDISLEPAVGDAAPLVSPTERR
jgi:RNA polymerase sigma factor (sigma-70 family)